MMNKSSFKYQYLGKNYPLIEGLEKLTGKAKYTDDMHFDGLLHACVMLSPFASAKIISVD